MCDQIPSKLYRASEKPEPLVEKNSRMQLSQAISTFCPFQYSFHKSYTTLIQKLSLLNTYFISSAFLKHSSVIPKELPNVSKRST